MFAQLLTSRYLLLALVCHSLISIPAGSASVFFRFPSGSRARTGRVQLQPQIPSGDDNQSLADREARRLQVGFVDRSQVEQLPQPLRLIATHRNLRLPSHDAKVSAPSGSASATAPRASEYASRRDSTCAAADSFPPRSGCPAGRAADRSTSGRPNSLPRAQSA